MVEWLRLFPGKEMLPSRQYFPQTETTVDESKLDWSRPFRHMDTKKPVFLNKYNHEGKDSWIVTYWDTDSRCWAAVNRKEIPLWVENVPLIRKLDFWLNIYPDHIEDCTAPTKEMADRVAHSSRIDCVHIVHEYEVKE